MTRECVKLKQELRNEVGYFKDIISNHLKTPIIAQIRALEILLDEKFGNLNEEQKEILENISASNSHILHIADNILTKYRAEKEILLKRKRVDIGHVLNKVLEKFQHIINGRKQVFIVNYGVLPLEIEIDENEILKVISNLVLNAIDFSPNNSLVRIDVANKGNFLEFEIKDEGPGINKKRRRKIFLPNITKRDKLRIIGTGFGLYISKKIIKAYGGDIKIKKTSEFGTTISFYLPLIH